MFNAGTPGFLGTAGRGILQGPHLSIADLSINKDTPLHALGEQGAVQFRAELFNMFNHPNFGMPSGPAFSGSVTSVANGTALIPVGNPATGTPTFGSAGSDHLYRQHFAADSAVVEGDFLI